MSEIMTWEQVFIYAFVALVLIEALSVAAIAMVLFIWVISRK